MRDTTKVLSHTVLNKLVYLGEKKRFPFKKACRAVGVDYKTTKEKVFRDNEEIQMKFASVFPGAFEDKNSKEPDMGPRKIRYEDMGALKVPKGTEVEALRKAWRPEAQLG